MSTSNILVTGAGGQIGTVLTTALADRYGKNHVLATDIRDLSGSDFLYEPLDIMNVNRLSELIDQYKITQIYHLVAILSARGEQAPLHTWDINMNSLFNVLEVARNKNISKIFFPSSIAVFGPGAQMDQTPQDGLLDPTTVYGISKVAAENWCNYYHLHYGMDIRSLRYPGIVSYQSLPGGGTTDYAVDIFHKALAQGTYTCFLSEHTALPMIYMDDAIRATIELMEAPADKIKIRTSYNLGGINFTPLELANAIQEELKDFTVEYKPDFRQAIADSWPNSIDDSKARADWGWKAAYDLKKMVKEMLFQLKNKSHQAV